MRPSKAEKPAHRVDGERASNTVSLASGNGVEATKNAGTTQGIAGCTFGAWTTIKADSTGRRVTVVCACPTVRLVALDALEAGESVGCGCVATPKLQVAKERVRRLPDWRPKR